MTVMNVTTVSKSSGAILKAYQLVFAEKLKRQNVPERTKKPDALYSRSLARSSALEKETYQEDVPSGASKPGNMAHSSIYNNKMKTNCIYARATYIGGLRERKDLYSVRLESTRGIEEGSFHSRFIWVVST